VISRCKFCKNGFFNTFFPLWLLLLLLLDTCHFETRPSLKNRRKCIWCALSAALPQKRVRWPHFLFHDFNKDSASFRWEKNWHNFMFHFLAVLLNCTDWAITGRRACVQFNSTLEREVETRAFKGIFLVRRWINNTFRSNSVRYHMHHRKTLSFLSSFGLRTVFAKGSEMAVFVSIVTSKRARWPPLFLTFLSSSWLVTSVHQVSSTVYVGFFY